LGVEVRNRVIKGLFSIGTSSVISMVLGFIGVTIRARVIPEEEFGVYFLLVAIAYLLQIIADFGLRLSAAKFVAGASDAQEQQVLVSNLLAFRLFSIAILSLVAFAAKPLLMSLYPSELLAPLFVFAPIMFATELADITLTSIMQGFLLVNKMAIIQVIASALNLGLTLLFILPPLSMGVEGFIIAATISLLISIVLRLWMIPARKRLALDRGVMHRIITFGLPLQGNDLLTFTFEKMDVLILGMLMGPTQIAYLEMAAKIPSYFRRLYYSLNSAVYFPNMSELLAQGRKEEAEHVMNNFLRMVAFIATFFALISVLFGREIVAVVFSERYMASAPALGLLMIELAISMASTILGIGLVAANHPAYLLLINLVTAVVSIATNLWLIPIVGFMGAVLARLASTVLANPVSVGCLYREKIRVSVAEYLKPILFLAICVALYLGLGWTSWPLKSLLLLLFISLSYAFSVFGSKDVSAVLKTFRFPARQVI